MVTKEELLLVRKDNNALWTIVLSSNGLLGIDVNTKINPIAIMAMNNVIKKARVTFHSVFTKEIIRLEPVATV